MRGEYTGLTVGETYESELPPRARRIPGACGVFERHLGTTSACAENTAVFSLLSSAMRNYLRVRGEYRLGGDHG